MHCCFGRRIIFTRWSIENPRSRSSIFKALLTGMSVTVVGNHGILGILGIESIPRRSIENPNRSCISGSGKWKEEESNAIRYDDSHGLFTANESFLLRNDEIMISFQESQSIKNPAAVHLKYTHYSAVLYSNFKSIFACSIRTCQILRSPHHLYTRYELPALSSLTTPITDWPNLEMFMKYYEKASCPQTTPQSRQACDARRAHVFTQ